MGLDHAQSLKALGQLNHSHSVPTPNDYALEHKQNESMDSSFSAHSVQSAPSYNHNYNYNHMQQTNEPPPSAYGAYNASQSLPQRSRQLSEGLPKTGAPEVVGDISSWKAQQKQNEEQKYNQQQN